MRIHASTCIHVHTQCFGRCGERGKPQRTRATAAAADLWSTGSGCTVLGIFPAQGFEGAQSPHKEEGVGTYKRGRLLGKGGQKPQDSIPVSLLGAFFIRSNERVCDPFSFVFFPFIYTVVGLKVNIQQTIYPTRPTHTAKYSSHCGWTNPPLKPLPLWIKLRWGPLSGQLSIYPASFKRFSLFLYTLCLLDSCPSPCSSQGSSYGVAMDMTLCGGKRQ